MAHTKKDILVGYVSVGAVLAVIYFAFQIPEWMEPERFRHTFVQDGGQWLHIDDLTKTIPEQQMSFVNMVRAVQDDARGQTDSQRQLTWIDFNKKLCSTKQPFELQKGWLGRVHETEVWDDGTLFLTIEVADGKAGTTFYLRDSLSASHPLVKRLVEANRPNLRFSGVFAEGDMGGDNECLDKATLTDFPEIESDTKVSFELLDIRILPEETFLLEGDQYRTVTHEVASKFGIKQ
jgi:hypothetical protein